MSSAMDVDDQPVEQVPSPAPQDETKGKGKAKDLEKKRFEVKKVLSHSETLFKAKTNGNDRSLFIVECCCTLGLG